MHNYYTIAHSLHHPGQLLYFNTPVLTSLNIETAGKIFLCFMWNVSVLPGGYAGDLLQWLPQSEPADGFSPMKKTQQARFKMHSGLWLVFSSEFHLMLCWNRVQSAQSTRLVTKSFVRMSCVRIPDNPANIHRKELHNVQIVRSWLNTGFGDSFALSLKRKFFFFLWNHDTFHVKQKRLNKKGEEASSFPSWYQIWCQ